MQIVLEGVRNTRRHGPARLAAINVQQVGEAIRITIDDDGVGFADSIIPPWTIASRVAEFGGRLAISSDPRELISRFPSRPRRLRRPPSV